MYTYCTFHSFKMWISWWNAPMKDPSTSSLTLSSMKKSPAWPTAATQRRPLRRVSAWAAARTAATIWVTRSTEWEQRETPKCTWKPVLRCPIKVGIPCSLVSKTGTCAQHMVGMCCRWEYWCFGACGEQGWNWPVVCHWIQVSEKSIVFLEVWGRVQKERYFVASF